MSQAKVKQNRTFYFMIITNFNIMHFKIFLKLKQFFIEKCVIPKNIDKYLLLQVIFRRHNLFHICSDVNAKIAFAVKSGPNANIFD